MLVKPVAFLLLVFLGAPGGSARTAVQPLGQVDLLALRAGGVSSGRLIKFVKDQGIEFKADPSYVHALQAAGADDALIKVLRRSKTINPSRLTAPQSASANDGLLLQHVERGAGLARDRAHLAGAQAEFAAALKLDPNDPYLHFALGSMLAWRNIRQQAVTEYEEAIRLQPDFWAAHRSLAGTLLDVDPAIAEYRRAIALVPDDYPEHLGLADLLKKKGDLQAAEEEEKVVKRLSASFKPPRVIHKVPVQYPDALKRAGVQGSVRLSALIWTDGSIKDLKVISGDPALAKLALDAVQQWRYKPAFLEGDPVLSEVAITMNFALSSGR